MVQHRTTAGRPVGPIGMAWSNLALMFIGLSRPPQPLKPSRSSRMALFPLIIYTLFVRVQSLVG